jgi:hypothetical protein
VHIAVKDQLSAFRQAQGLGSKGPILPKGRTMQELLMMIVFIAIDFSVNMTQLYLK